MFHSRKTPIWISGVVDSASHLSTNEPDQNHPYRTSPMILKRYIDHKYITNYVMELAPLEPELQTYLDYLMLWFQLYYNTPPLGKIKTISVGAFPCTLMSNQPITT